LYPSVYTQLALLYSDSFSVQRGNCIVLSEIQKSNSINSTNQKETNLNHKAVYKGREVAHAKTPGGVMRQIYAQFRKEIDAGDFAWTSLEIVKE
jgi:hypothetical protein